MAGPPSPSGPPLTPLRLHKPSHHRHPQNNITNPTPRTILNIAKGTTDPRVEFILQDHSAEPTKLEYYNFQISIINQALTSKSQPNISILTKSKVRILTKPRFRILTKI